MMFMTQDYQFMVVVDSAGDPNVKGLPLIITLDSHQPVVFNFILRYTVSHFCVSSNRFVDLLEYVACSDLGHAG